MTSVSPSGALDLVVVGGLTVDRFSDGSAAPGGAVLHIARALAARGVRVGIVTTAGPEPEALAGLAELRDLALPGGSLDQPCQHHLRPCRDRRRP